MKNLNELNEYLMSGDYDPFEIGENENENEIMKVINEYIQTDILDKGKKLTPSKLNGLLIKLENKSLI